MTCKDCIHYDFCLQLKDRAALELPDGAEKDCDGFKNKADFVEVVRCKNCKHRYSYDDFDRNTREMYKCSGCELFHKSFGDDGFCSYGERRDT